jgi:hypothetical protein
MQPERPGSITLNSLPTEIKGYEWHPMGTGGDPRLRANHCIYILLISLNMKYLVSLKYIAYFILYLGEPSEPYR